MTTMNETGKTILIIDDSNTALLLMDYALKEAGYHTQLATGVNEALGLITRKKPDLILLDLSMPEISGYDFLKMTSDLHLEKVPVIIVSAFDSAESISTSQALGAVEFIAKPIRIDNLLEKIREYL